MNYEEARKYIDSIAAFGSKLGLENIRNLMHYLGDPQDRLKFVHVAGTNGKGSTVAFISNILMSAGYRVGIYTSPFVERFSERIKVDLEEISGDAFARLATQVKEAVDKMKEAGLNEPTEFELICAIAFLYFAEKACDICVLEVGLGGRLDATNVIDAPLLCVITPISYDHMDILGNTLEEIAAEKAGIIKSGSDVLLYPQSGNVEAVFERICEKNGAALHICTLPEGFIKADTYGVEFELEGKRYEIGLLGNYQINNAAMAVHAAGLLRDRGLRIEEEDIYKGLKNTGWRARFEILRRDPVFITDGSHNRQGMEVLKESLKLYFGDKKIILIIGILRDKEYGRMLDIILPVAKRVYTVTVPSPRTLSAIELKEEVSKRSAAEVSAIEDPKEAAKLALKEAAGSDVICACGSLYYLGELYPVIS